MISSPVVPVNTVSVRVMTACAVIETIQVRVMAVIVPPGTLVFHSTRAAMGVVVLVSSAELVSQLSRQRIPFRNKQQQAHQLHAYYVKPWGQHAKFFWPNPSLHPSILPTALPFLPSGGNLPQTMGVRSRPEATTLPPSILLSTLPSRGLSRGSGQSPLTRCQSF